MLDWTHRNLPLVLAAALSLLLHTAVLFPVIEVIGLGRHNSDEDRQSMGKSALGLTGSTRDSELDKLRERRERERQVQRKLSVRRMQREDQLVRRLEKKQKPEEKRPDEPEKRAEPRIELGIDDSNAVTMNWIGYAEYEKHLAALSEVEQAALRLESASGAGGTASSSLPPAPPAATVAMSPNPSVAPLPASAGGSDAPQETTLVVPTATTPSSPPAATARTEPGTVAGTEAERARPAEPPEQKVDEPGPTPADHGAADSPQQPVETPVGPPSPDPNAPALAETKPQAADGLKPAPAPSDPTKVDPKADPLRRDDEKAPPSTIDPERRMNPAPSGATENAPPRENADPTIDSLKPPTEAPPSDKDPATETERTQQQPGTDGEARNPSDRPATDPTGGGVKGPEVINGQSSVPVQPSPAGASGDTRASQGTLSNRESDATSIIDVPMKDWQNGKPLARRGLTLTTVKPKLTSLNYIDGVSFNPIVEIVMGRDGVPQHVVVSRSCGNPGVNEAIRSALYKWRGVGKQLEQLKPGQTVTIRIRLLMLRD